MHHKTFLGLLLLFILIISAGFIFTQQTRPVEAAGNGNVSGYAWSSNIGWISFKGVTTNGTYAVNFIPENATEDPDDGFFAGYAWSSNIGWIKFDPSGPFVDGSGVALPDPSSRHGVLLSADGTTITGWARAVSVLGSCPTEPGPMKCNSDRGGWDGWISMSGLTGGGGGSYGVTKIGNELRGFAWGNTNLGWINFCTTPGTSACVSVDNLNVACSVNPTSADLGQDITWTATDPVDDGFYTYTWAITGVTPNPTGVSYTKLGGYPSAQTVSANLVVAGVTGSVNDGKYGSANCPNVLVSNSGQKILNVVVQGPPTTVSPSGVSYGHVGGDGGAINCGAGGNADCDETYAVSVVDPKTITLTANVPVLAPLPAVVAFNNWSGGVSCNEGQNTSSCTFTINAGDNSPIDVYANFKDNNSPPGSAILTASPFFTKIRQQTDRIPTRSSESRITAVNGDVIINVCVMDIVSKINDRSLEDIVDEALRAPGDSGPNVAPACLFDGESEDCFSGNNCFPVSPGGTVSKQFSIMLDDKFYEVKVNSPYEVRIDAKTEDGTMVDSLTWPELQFLYEVQDVHPR
jgi:hypothetical protein